MQYLILAAEGGEASPIDLIFPAAAELVYGLLAFVIVFAIISRFALPRLNTMLDERTESIQGQMEAAERAKQEAAQQREQQKEEVKEARREAQRIVEDARQSAEQLRRDLIADGEAQKAAIVSQGRTEIEAERDRLLQELRAEVGTLSVRLAEKIVQKEIDQSDHRNLVDDYIRELSRSN